MTSRVSSGLEVLLRDGHPLVGGRRVALLTHPAGVDRDGRSAVDLLIADRRWSLVALFGPEHGVRGDAQAGVHVASGLDGQSGLMAYSLYGTTRVPTDEMLTGVETIVIDLQDIGVRYFTYPATVVGCIEVAAAQGIDVVILDRPAPLTGDHIEGGLLLDAHRSFVGVHTVPIRHGLTLGELARLVALERGLPAPAVIPAEGWRRAAWHDETGLPWCPPSPNLRSLDAVLLYVGTCLIEGTNVSEGRGTDSPFAAVGAPWIEPEALLRRLGDRRLPGLALRAAVFRPTMSKHAGERCGGVELTVSDRAALRPAELGLALLEDLIAVSGERFEWRDAAFDRLAGDPAVRRTLNERASLGSLIERWQRDARDFAQRRAPHLLYRDDGLS